MQVNIIVVVAALMAASVLAYRIGCARYRLLWSSADSSALSWKRKKEAADRATVNMKADRDHFESRLIAAYKERDSAKASMNSALRDRDAARESRDQYKANAGSERNRANSLQQELTAERAKPKTAPIAEALGHGQKVQRKKLSPRYVGVDLAKAAADRSVQSPAPVAAPKPAPATPYTDPPLVGRVRAIVGKLNEIEAEKLANALSTNELRGNKLRIEIKPIMRQFGFEEKRVARKGRGGAQHRVWRRK